MSFTIRYFLFFVAYAILNCVSMATTNLDDLAVKNPEGFGAKLFQFNTSSITPPMEYSNDRTFLHKSSAETQSALISVGHVHLFDKSADRVDFVRDYLAREVFCDCDCDCESDCDFYCVNDCLSDSVLDCNSDSDSDCEFDSDFAFKLASYYLELLSQSLADFRRLMDEERSSAVLRRSNVSAQVVCEEPAVGLPVVDVHLCGNSTVRVDYAFDNLGRDCDSNCACDCDFDADGDAECDCNCNCDHNCFMLEVHCEIMVEERMDEERHGS